MEPDILERIEADPVFHELVKRRKRVGYVLSAGVVVVYFGYVMIIAFWPDVLTTLLESGLVTTVGMPVALVTLLFVIMCTGYYVYLANVHFDRLKDQVVKNLDQ